MSRCESPLADTRARGECHCLCVSARTDAPDPQDRNMCFKDAFNCLCSHTMRPNERGVGSRWCCVFFFPEIRPQLPTRESGSIICVTGTSSKTVRLPVQDKEENESESTAVLARVGVAADAPRYPLVLPHPPPSHCEGCAAGHTHTYSVPGHALLKVSEQMLSAAGHWRLSSY